MTLVSVLVPAFNAEKWIAAAIESALNQTWPAVEVVVVDDGSTDGTLSVARRYQGERVRVFSQKNRGAAAARNRGLLESRGSVIQYLDADDLLATDKIERQLKAMGGGVICSGEWGTFYGDPDKALFVRDALWADLAPVDFLVTAWMHGLMMQTGAWLVEKGLVVRAGPWDERLSLDDDGEFFARAVLASKGVRFCPAAKVFYRFGNTGSLSWARSPKAVRSNALAAELCTGHLLRAEDSDRTRRAAGQKLMAFIYNTYPQAPDLIRAAEQRISALGLQTTPRPVGGPVFRRLSSIIGWKAAKMIREPCWLARVQLSRLLDG